MIKVSTLLPVLFCLNAALPGRAQEATIRVRANDVLGRVTRTMTGACIEDVNHEIYGGLYSQMIFGESFQEAAPKSPATEISGMWRGLQRGKAEGCFAIETNQPFAGRQSQWIMFLSGQGELGIENQGLNR